jgi:hypothetical protein
MLAGTKAIRQERKWERKNQRKDKGWVCDSLPDRKRQKMGSLQNLGNSKMYRE